jgi:hypothetical protein
MYHVDKSVCGGAIFYISKLERVYWWFDILIKKPPKNEAFQ